MPFILIRRRRNKQDVKEQAKNIMREIQDKTPENLMNEDDSAIKFEFITILPQTNDCAILIKLNDQETEFSEAGFIDLSKPNTVLDIVHPIPEANRIWRKQLPPVPVKVNEPLTVGLVGCDSLLQSFEELKKSEQVPKYTYTQVSNQGQQEEVTTTLEVRNHQNNQFSHFFFIAVDCTNANALEDVKNFINKNIILNNRPRVVLTPINYTTDHANSRKLIANDVEQFAQKNNCIYAKDLLQISWDDIFCKLTGRPTKAQAAQKEQMKTIIAKQNIKRLIGDLENEVGRNAFIRFFTDFNHTKSIKLDALKKIDTAIQNIDDFDQLSKTVNNHINNHPQKDKVLFTTRPLASRTATLINEITENNGEALLKHPLENTPTSTPNA